MSPVFLNLVVLRCADLERAAGFYSELGLAFVRHQHGTGPEHLTAEVSGVVFELYPAKAGRPATSGTRIGFRVAAVDAVVTALAESYPGAVVTPPSDSEWGRRAAVADPDGHRVELVQG